MIEKPGLSKNFWSVLPMAILFSVPLWIGIIYGIVKIWDFWGAN